MKKLILLLLIPLNLQAFAQVSNKDGKKQNTMLMYGKIIYLPAVPAIILPGTSNVKHGPVPMVIPPGFTEVGSGYGVLNLRSLTNRHIKIKEGTYSGINLEDPSNVKIDASGVTIEGGSLDISSADNLEISGLSVINFNYRGVNIRGLSNGLYFHDMTFKNIGNYTISYEYNGVYDGTDKTASMNWKFEHLTFENTGPGVMVGGGFDGQGIRNLMKNFKFLDNTIKNCPGIGNIVWAGAADNYEIAGNTIDNINMSFPDNARNGIHNGIFMMTGNGSFHDNKIRNHQGNAIRAWGMSYGGEAKDILIYNNVVYNSWKYSAFELQMTPDMQAYIKRYPSRATYTNARVFNNTAGHLNISKDWDGQLLDVYTTGGTLEYYNNLGFDLVRSQGQITNMINWNGDTKMTRTYGNKYFSTQKEAVADIRTFRSLHKGTGAQL